MRRSANLSAPTRPAVFGRRLVPALAVGALVLAACGSDDDSADTADTTAGSIAPADSTAAAGSTAGSTGGAGDCSATLEAGTLTIATGDRGVLPWVIDDAPETGQGFEAAVALAGRQGDGLRGRRVVWTRTTFDEAIQPGPKTFDMNLQQYSITPERQENVDMSLPLLHEQPGDGRARRLGSRRCHHRRRPQGREVRRPGAARRASTSSTT
jgi:polar amino acid transport system substrate-binding protein